MARPRGLATLLVASALLAGCSDSPTSETDPTTHVPPPTQAAVARTPVECLKAAKLDRAREYDKDVWRGFAPDGTVVVVQSVGPGIALNEAERATGVWAYAAGPYFIQGPAKAADGSFTTQVADCLRVGRTE